jgi:hypothetical protein
LELNRSAVFESRMQLEARMSENRRPLASVPYGADRTVYLVVDRVGSNVAGYREADVERADLETAIDELLLGQFNDPVRVIAFNTLEHWAEDVSAMVAAEIQLRCDINGERVPEHVKDFVGSHAGSIRKEIKNPPALHIA